MVDSGRSPPGPGSRPMGRAALRRLAGFATSIPGAARNFIGWLGPFGVWIAGMFLLMVGVSVGPKPHIAVSVLGGLMLLSAMETYGERAKSKETERWAKHIAQMLGGDDHATTFEVHHTFQNLRPELDELVAREVASAIEARRAAAENTDAVHESAVTPKAADAQRKGS